LNPEPRAPNGLRHLLRRALTAGCGQPLQPDRCSSRPRLARPARVLTPAILVGAVLALYAPTCSYELLDWDDSFHVTENPSVVSGRAMGLAERLLPRGLGYPMPLTLATYRLDRLRVPRTGETLEAKDGAPFHQTQVVLALALAAAALIFLRELVPPLHATAAAAILLAHPLGIELVAWVTGRKDLLATTLSLLALAAWLRFLRRGAASWALVFGLLAAGAIASKPSAVYLAPLAAALILGDRTTARRRAATWGAIAAVSALAAASIVVGYGWHVALGGVEETRGLGEVLRRSLFALGFHASLVLSPADLQVRYPIAPAGPSGYDALGITLLVAAAVALVRAPKEAVAIRAGIALGLLGYLPSSGLIPLRRYLAATYAFPLLLGTVVAVAGLVAHAGARGKMTRRGRGLLSAGAAALVALLAFSTARQLPAWRDSVSLWSRQVEQQPENAADCRMLGHAFNQRGDHRAAASVYESCARRHGPELFALNLGISYFLLGEDGPAEKYLRLALTRRPGDPRALRFLGLLERRRPPRGPGP
jgi:protein O-mannosyl-transferase